MRAPTAVYYHATPSTEHHIVKLRNIANRPDLNTMWSIRGETGIVGILSKTGDDWNFTPNFLGGKVAFSYGEIVEIVNILLFADYPEILTDRGWLDAVSKDRGVSPLEPVDSSVEW